MADFSGEDRQALVDLLPRLKRFCLVLTGNPADADDLLQATVERLLRGSTMLAITRCRQSTAPERSRRA